MSINIVTPWIVVAQLISVSLLGSAQNDQTVDVCSGDGMDLSCPSDSALVIHSAAYGRMRYNQCLRRDEMIGCTNNVLFLLDQWCSGLPSCERLIPNGELENVNEDCWEILKMYLHITYTCVRVTPSPHPTCTTNTPVIITATEGFISSHVTDTTGCGTSLSPWQLQAMDGQTIELILHDMGSEVYERKSNMTGSTGPVPLYGHVMEGQKRHAIQGGQDRQKPIYTSSTNSVKIEMSRDPQRNTRYLVQFRVIGCPELKPPAHAWYKRDGSQAVIGCEWSQTTWHLSCDGHRWSGVVGNCSEPVTKATVTSQEQYESEQPLALLLTCVVSVAVVLVVILIVICVVCLKKQRIKQHVAKKMVATPGHYDLDPSIEMGSILFFPNKPCDCPDPQPLVPLVDLGEQNPEQGQGQECNPLHIWEQPLPELPPKTKRKSTTDSTMGTRTGRTPGDGDEHVSDVMEGDVRSLNSEPFSTQSSHKYSPLEKM